MSGQKSEEIVFTSSKNASAITTASSGVNYLRERIARNFQLIWVDANIDESTEDYKNTLAELRSVVNDINIFTKRDEAIDFLTEAHEMNIFLIVEDTIGQHIVPLIHDIPELTAIYIFGGNQSGHEQWTMEWVKIKGVHMDIKPICEALQLAAKQCNQDSIAVSFVSVSEGATDANLNQLEPSFMYTQIFKEILLEVEHNEQSIKDFVQFWRHHYIDNITKLKVIDEFENNYCPQFSIRWYTREYFVYEMLNRSLRILEADSIINMGFFIRDLHKQIQELHQKQVSSYHGTSFTVYRGQGLLKTDFEKLVKTQGGLMSFNNFLSTSKNREVSLVFAKSALTKTNMIGIFFKMIIDPSVSSTPFASIRDVSYYKTEEEILFSMHTVFRIDEIKKIDDNNSLYQVDLTLTADDDQQLRTLTKTIRQEVAGETGWQRLGLLLLKLSQFAKAEELFNVLLEQTSDEGDKQHYYNYLGYIKNNQGDYENAIEYYEKALKICQKTLPPNHPSLAISNNNIGNVYGNMGEYLKALSFFDKALEIKERILLPNDTSLATSYNNNAGVYYQMGEYSKALSFFEKALEINQNHLPPNHPDLATSYNNIGGVYDKMREYSKALSFYEKTREIFEKTLPPNHPSLATSYNNIGLVYNNMGRYSKALYFYEKACEIFEKTLPPNHPDLATSYSNIGSLYDEMGEYTKALLSHEKALQICQITLPPNHPSLAISNNNIGNVYGNMGEYSKALSFFDKALEIKERILLPNDTSLATSYNNNAGVYYQMGEYSKALSFFEKALEINQNHLPPNHPDLATSYNNIGGVYEKMREYSKALSFYEKACEIFEKALPSNHPDLATSYSNIGSLYDEMEEYTKALSSHEKALQICQITLPPNHPDFAQLYNNMASVYYSMKEYSKALSYFERALNIFQSSLPANHPSIKSVRGNIEALKNDL